MLIPMRCRRNGRVKCCIASYLACMSCWIACMLYNSNNICVFYGNNSWSYTPLGKVDSLSAEELKAFFGTGDISVTYSLKQ